MLIREVQPENVAALPSKSVSNLSNDFGILILLSDVQPLNASQPIVITELGIIMERIPIPLNAPPPILTKELGKIREVMLEQPEKADIPILVSELGSETEVVLEHPTNPKSPIWVTLVPIIIFLNFEP